MITVIKKGATAKTVKEKLENHVKKPPQKDISKYCGVLELKKDPVKLQKEWRDEWE